MAAHTASRHPGDLTDQQWDLIGRFLPEMPRRHDGRGRPWQDRRVIGGASGEGGLFVRGFGTRRDVFDLVVVSDGSIDQIKMI